MEKHLLHKKALIYAVLFVMFLNFIGLINAAAQTFTVGNLNYSVNSDGITVTVTGHVNDTNATGELIIPSEVAYNNVTYTVTNIVNNAFKDCSGLTGELTIPNSVTNIGQYAFYGCSGLHELTIGTGVTDINDYAFWNCSSLTTVHFNATNCSNMCTHYSTYLYSVFGNGFIGGNNEDGENAITTLTIGNNVTNIPDGAFRNSTSLLNVEIPNSVTRIGEIAFAMCSGLTSLIIPNSVTSIGQCAFYECTGLTGSLNIPNSVTSIGQFAFYECTGLNGDLTIPNSVTSIGMEAFKNCSGFTGNLIIPNSLTAIDISVFYGCSSFSILTIPNSMTELYLKAFADCTGLTSIASYAITPPTLQNSVFANVDKAIPVYVPAGTVPAYQAALGWCEFTNIQENSDLPITFADANVKALCVANWDTNNDGELNYNEAAAVTSLGFVFYDNDNITSFDELQYFTSLTSIGERAFAYCQELISLEIPHSVNEIGMRTFYGCSNLTTIVIPDSVETIGAEAFVGINATHLELPASVSNIGYRAFIGESFESIVVDQDNTVYDSRGNCNAIIQTETNKLITGCKNTIIPDNVTVIGNNAFFGCENLTLIEIPGSVYKIEKNAFCHTGITDLEIPASVEIIQDMVFSDTNIENINVAIDNTVYDSRDNCNAIIETTSNKLITGCKNTIIPNSVISIGKYAFAYCTSLLSIELPNSVVEIGKGAFDNCNNLMSLKLSDSLETIGSYAFYNCRNLTSLVIPKSVTVIGEFAFEFCYGLSSITCLSETPATLGSGVFCDTNKSIPVYVPIGSVSAYQAAPGWCEFTNIQGIGTHWSPISGTEYNMIVSGVIKIDNELQNNPLLEVGAFCGDECRGSSFARLFQPTGEYVAQITVVSNAVSGETINFRLYDHETHMEKDVVCFNTVEFIKNGEIGTIGDWYEYDFISSDNIQYINLTEGWNWWSTHLEQSGIDGLETLKDTLGSNGLCIKSQTNALQNYYQQLGYNYWFGELHSIDNESSYMINMAGSFSSLIIGTGAVSANHPITIVPGWNWIGYPVNVAQSVEAAFANFSAEAGDVVKNQSESSIYYDNYGWFPSFNMMPGGGYLYMSNADSNKTLLYDVSRSGEVATTDKNHVWVSNRHEFANNLTIVATVYLNDEQMKGENIELGAFVGDDYRGSVRLNYFEPLDCYYAVLTVSGENGDKIHFGIVDRDNYATNFNCQNEIVFENNAVYGNIDNPYEINFHLDNDEMEMVGIYPNPVDNGNSFNLAIPNDEVISEVVITDVMGRVVSRVLGDNRIVNGLSTPCVYCVSVVTKSGKTYHGRLIVK